MIAYLSTLAVLVSVAALVGLGLNFQWGVAGLVNFGVVGFVALGAYATALTVPYAGWLGAMVIAAAVSAAMSTVLAFLSTRLCGELPRHRHHRLWRGGRYSPAQRKLADGRGARHCRHPAAVRLLVPAAQYDAFLLGFAVLLVIVTFLVLEMLVRSPLGRALRAVRDDPTVAGALGKPVLLLRIKAFAIGGAVMGIAGSLHAFYLTYIDPSQFTSIITAYAFMAVILGGRGSNVGLVIGAGTIMALIEATRFLKDALNVVDGAQLAALRLGLIGIGIILLLILRPQGMLAEPYQRVRDFFPDDKEGR